MKEYSCLCMEQTKTKEIVYAGLEKVTGIKSAKEITTN